MFCKTIDFFGVAIGIWLAWTVICVYIAYYDENPQEIEKKVYTYKQGQIYECSALKEGLMVCQLKP